MSIESNKIYKLIGKNDYDAVVDIEGQSQSQDANLVINTQNDNNSQKVMPILDADNYYKYKMLGSNLYMMLHTGAATPGAIVKQYADTGADIFKWKTEEVADSKAVINGVEYDTYNIKHKPDETLQLDYITDITEADRHLKVQTADPDNEGQQFALLPDSLFNNTLPAPTNSFSGYILLPKYSQTYYDYNTYARGYNDFQIRCRKRGLIHNTNTFGDWGDWESPEESKQDNGWGNAWTYNAQGWMQRQKIITNEEPYDAYQYQMETRVFVEQEGKPTHGNTTTTTMLSVPQLESGDVGLDNVVIGASGIIFEFHFDYDREVGKEVVLNRIYNTTKDREVFEGEIAFTLAPGQREFILPFEELRSLPDLEDMVNVNITYKMLDSILPTQTIVKEQEKQVSYDGGTLVPEIKLTPINDYDYFVEILNTDITDSDISLLYKHDGKVNVGKLSKKSLRKYKLAAPVGTQFRLYVYIENETEWGAKVFTFDFGKKLAIVFNTYTSEVAFTYFPNGWKDFTIQKDAGFETLKLEGRDYEKVFYSTVKGSKLSLDAWFLNTDRQKIEMALNDGFALLRTPQEYYSVVAITGIQYEPGDEKLTRVKIDMQEVDNEVDYSIPG